MAIVVGVSYGVNATRRLEPLTQLPERRESLRHHRNHEKGDAVQAIETDPLQQAKRTQELMAIIEHDARPNRHLGALLTSSPIAEAGRRPSSARDKQGADPSEQQQCT